MFSEIVEVPAIMSDDGSLQLANPELKELDKETLGLFVKATGGRLVWLKRRVTYTELETPLCTHKDCYRPVKGISDCGDHS